MSDGLRYRAWLACGVKRTRFPHVRWAPALFAGLLLAPAACRDDSGTPRKQPAGTRTGLFPEVEEIQTTTFTRAEVCGACHRAIYTSWHESMHSRAWSDPVFQAAYRETAEKHADEGTRVCLTCHAPIAHELSDYAVEQPITREGSTCDFCHSVRSVDLAAAKPFDVHLGRTKYGPLKHAQSPAHEIANSPLHKTAEFCAPCHEYRNRHGVDILTTYSEWKESSYAQQGKHCQDCHMPMVPGRVVALGLQAAARAGVNLHDISGSHDIERVRQAVTMEILSVAGAGPRMLRVRVKVGNVGSGHCFPTGLPMHRAILEVNLTDRGRLVKQRTVEFEKVLLNEAGLPVDREHEAFLDARSVRSDTRLKPGEERTVTVTLDDVDAPEGMVEATLWYQYSTRTLQIRDGTETIEPVEMKFLLISKKHNAPATGG